MAHYDKHDENFAQNCRVLDKACHHLRTIYGFKMLHPNYHNMCVLVDIAELVGILECRVAPIKNDCSNYGGSEEK
jgi:hypothetical protein